jgi:hypothetical protein
MFSTCARRPLVVETIAKVLSPPYSDVDGNSSCEVHVVYIGRHLCVFASDMMCSKPEVGCEIHIASSLQVVALDIDKG